MDSFGDLLQAEAARDHCCATDAIGLVTGCKLGRRALKFRDWGKMAASA